MADAKHPKLARTIFTQYRDNFGLFWCIMAPVAVVAIALSTVLFFQSVRQLEKSNSDTFGANTYTVVSRVDTINGVYPDLSSLKTGDSSDASTSDVSWELLPIPYFSSTDSEGSTWRWELNFQIFDYSVLILLLLTLYPLSLAVAQVSRSSDAEVFAPPNARSIWRQTGRKALAVLLTPLLYALIMDVGSLILSLGWTYQPFHRIPDVVLNLCLFGITLFIQCYFFVTLSVYNPCLSVEDMSIIGVFRRIHALVKGARWRFLGIYFLTGWLASVVTSVLLGTALFTGSLFVTGLEPLRGALSPLTFLTLFVGGDIAVVLPALLSVPATAAVLIVKGLIATFLVPIWAILTTHLYFQRVDAIEEAT